VELPVLRPDIVVAPEPANILLSAARDQEDRDTGDRVLVGVDRLSHSLFAELATGFGGGAVAVVAAPFEPLVYIDMPPANPPSWWSRADPPGTWLTLATGFPWYLGSAVAAAALFWLLPLLRRC
jgi:hypothetical protein